MQVAEPQANTAEGGLPPHLFTGALPQRLSPEDPGVGTPLIYILYKYIYFQMRPCIFPVVNPILT